MCSCPLMPMERKDSRETQRDGYRETDKQTERRGGGCCTITIIISIIIIIIEYTHTHTPGDRRSVVYRRKKHGRLKR